MDAPSPPGDRDDGAEPGAEGPWGISVADENASESRPLIDPPRLGQYPTEVPKRLITGLLLHTGLVMAYLMRVNLSVAIASMGHDGEHGGLVLGAFFVGYLPTQVPGGWASARLGGAPVLISGIFLCSLLALATAFTAGNVWLLVAIRAAQGLCQGVVFPATITIVSKWAPVREQSRMMGTVMVGGIVGTVLGFMMSGVICAIPSAVGLVGWQLLFVLHGGMGLLWCALSLAFLRSSPSRHPTITVEEYDLITHGQQTMEKPAEVPWAPLLTSPPAWAAFSAHLAYNWVFYCFLTCLPKYMRDIFHFDLAGSGLTSAVPYIAMSLVNFSAGYVADHFINAGVSKTVLRRLFISAALITVSTLLLGLSWLPNQAASLAALVAGFAILGLPASSMSLMFLDLSPNYAGVLHGFSNTLTTLLGIVTPVLIYRVAAHGTPEEWHQVFVISFGVVVSGALIFAMRSESTIQAWNSPSGGRGVPSEASVSFNTAVLKGQSSTLIY